VVYGTGDGVNTFNLPDLRGRVPVGEDSAGVRLANAAGRDRGESGGEEKHTLTLAEAPAHSHVNSAGANFLGSGPGGSFGLQSDTASGGLNGIQLTAGSLFQGGTDSQGGGGSHNNMQPFQVVNYLIKT
jgi:microcystin-dependent protein